MQDYIHTFEVLKIKGKFLVSLSFSQATLRMNIKVTATKFVQVCDYFFML